MQIGFPPNYHYDAISYSSKAITSFLPNSIIQDLSFDSTFTLEEGSDCLQSSLISQSSNQNFPKPKQHQYSDCAMFRNQNEKNFAFNKGVIKPTKKKSERINQKMNMEYDFINFNMSFTNFLLLLHLYLSLCYVNFSSLCLLILFILTIRFKIYFRFGKDLEQNNKRKVLQNEYVNRISS